MRPDRDRLETELAVLIQSALGPEAALWQLYLLECVNGSVYTGIARDAHARFVQHLGGKGARYTRMHHPSRLLAIFQFPDRASASRAEFLIKQLSPAQKRALVLSGGPPTSTRLECVEPDPDRSCPDL